MSYTPECIWCMYTYVSHCMCIHPLYSVGYFCTKADLPLQTQEPIGAVASRCFPHPTLSLASEETWKDLKRSQGHQHGGEESGFG